MSDEPKAWLVIVSGIGEDWWDEYDTEEEAVRGYRARIKQGFRRSDLILAKNIDPPKEAPE